MPTRARVRRRRIENLKGAGLLILGLGIIVPVAGGLLWFILNRPAVDRASGCLQSGYQSVTSILVDTTDALTPVQAAALRNVMEKFRDAVPKYGRLEVFGLEPITTKPLQAIFSGCSPGSAKDVDSELRANATLAQRHWERDFGDKVSETSDELLKMPTQERSPIFEAIQSVTVTTFETEKTQNASSKVLVLVSDFIQNVPDLTMYKGVPDYAKFKDSQYYRQIRAKLNGVDVYLYWIPRRTKNDVQTAKLRDFWRQYIADVGGDSKEWVSLE